MKAGRACL
jgi:hypothetical protein